MHKEKRKIVRCESEYIYIYIYSVPYRYLSLNVHTTSVKMAKGKHKKIRRIKALYLANEMFLMCIKFHIQDTNHRNVGILLSTLSKLLYG